VNVRTIAPRLHYWTAAHPAWNEAQDWPQQVGCVCYETATVAVLIDEPGGTAAEGQVAFYLRSPRALVVAEFFRGVDGGLQVLASPAERDQRPFRKSLLPPCELPIDHVRVAHGEPVLHDGHRRIAEALRDE
jgi:hypothetical protein